MKDPTRVLFISQEIYPYLPDETPMRMLNRKLPELCQANGCETRTFMPKFGDINERRNQLHEVIRLSGMNIIIDDTDHPLLLKVASIQSARIQIYFVDNDDYFRRRKGVSDPEGNNYADNDERMIFYARGVLETVEKLRWTPNVILCSGWMSALAPLYIKKAYSDTPFFKDAKVVYALFDQQDMMATFNKDFSKKLMVEGIAPEDIKKIQDKKVGYEELMKLAIDYSDAVIESDPAATKLLSYAKRQKKIIMPYKGEGTDGYLDFLRGLIPPKEAKE